MYSLEKTLVYPRKRLRIYSTLIKPKFCGSTHIFNLRDHIIYVHTFINFSLFRYWSTTVMHDLALRLNQKLLVTDFMITANGLRNQISSNIQ